MLIILQHTIAALSVSLWAARHGLVGCDKPCVTRHIHSQHMGVNPV